MGMNEHRQVMHDHKHSDALSVRLGTEGGSTFTFCCCNVTKQIEPVKDKLKSPSSSFALMGSGHSDSGESRGKAERSNRRACGVKVAAPSSFPCSRFVLILVCKVLLETPACRIRPYKYLHETGRCEVSAASPSAVFGIAVGEFPSMTQPYAARLTYFC
jgi:hypothetical protein